MLQPTSFFRPPTQPGHTKGAFTIFVLLPFVVLLIILRLIWGLFKTKKGYQRIYPEGYVKDKKKYKRLEEKLYGNRI